MISPIRIEGAGGPGSQVPTGSTVSYEAPDGESWVLASASRHDAPAQHISLLGDGVSGFVGSVERGKVESVGRLGVRPDGWKLPPLDISLKYRIRAVAGGLESAVRSWRRAWDFEEPGDYGSPQPSLKPGRLQVHSQVGDSVWTPVSEPAFPDWPDNLRRRRALEETLSCTGYLGHWWGSTQRFTGEAVVRPPGDRPLSPALRLVWDGSASSVSFPSGLSVSFPSIGSPRFINLDRGMSGQMTRLDGSVDTGGWSSLQGIVHGMSLRPGVETVWNLGPGMTLEVTPRYLSPWR